MKRANAVARAIVVLLLLTGATAALHGTSVAFTRSDGGPEEALRAFMDARITRQHMVVLGLLAGDFVETGDHPYGVFQVSNPCWCRWEELDVEPVSPVSVLARVRVYEHWWMGDVVNGP